MSIFLTGATGFIGSRILTDLLQEGRAVTALVRSPDKARQIEHIGAKPVLGSLDDLDTLRDAAAASEGVIHTAFGHDFTRFIENCEADVRAIAAMGEALKGTSKPILVSAGAALIAPGRPVTEADAPGPRFALPRRSEFAARELAARGVRAATVRIGLAHGPGDTGFLPFLVQLARQTGVSAYVGDGENRWPGVHRDDAARLFSLVLKEGVTRPVYHAAAEEGIPFREIATQIGRGLGVPVEPRDAGHFDWFGGFAAIDMPQSSIRTQELTGWHPQEIGLLPDLGTDAYLR